MFWLRDKNNNFQLRTPIWRPDIKESNLCLFDLILYVPSTIFQLNRDGSSWVEPVLN